MKILLTAILASLALGSQASTEIVYPPRSEIYAVPSLTISDKQFLEGDKGGKEVTVGGILRFPQKPVSPKIPVVFLVHGSSGMGPNIDYWSNHFLGQGYATFSVDGFTGRGLTTVGPDQALLGRLNLILDSYRAMEVLAKHPRLDSNKFVMMGFSRGGQATLFASLERFNTMWNKSGTVFAAHIPFYADCVTSYIGDDKTTGKPIQLHHGITDDYNPIAACKAIRMLSCLSMRSGHMRLTLRWVPSLPLFQKMRKLLEGAELLKSRWGNSSIHRPIKNLNILMSALS
jgi:dienelactone hydrolase